MTLGQNFQALKVFRGLHKELQLIYKSGQLRERSIYNFIVDQFKRNDVTSQQICRGETEALHLGKTYLCYLESVRKHQELIDKYKGQGEKTVDQAAKLVGLNLPETKPN